MLPLSRRYRSTLVLVLVSFAMTLAAACGGGTVMPAGGDETPRAGGMLRYGLLGDPVSIEPLNAQEAGGLQVAHQVFEGLTRWELDDAGNMRAVPGVAGDWDARDGGATWIFHLRNDVTFQAPVSRRVVAQDFVDSWTRVTDPENRSYVSYILAPVAGCDDRGWQTDPVAGLTGVKALDDSTLQVTLRYPFAEFPIVVGHPVAAVTPVEYIDEVGEKAFAEKPVGTGPFVVSSWKHGKSVRLVKNATYWNADARPWIDRVVMPIYGDLPAMWEAFTKGRLDVTRVPSDEIEGLASSERVKGGEWSDLAWPSLAVAFVGINMTDPELGQSGELRAAIAAATDAATVIQDAGHGIPAAANGFVPPGVAGGGSSAAGVGYDPARALSLVQGLGAAPRLSYWSATGEDARTIADILVKGWEAGGIQVKAQEFQWATFYDKLSRASSGSGAQLFFVGYIANYPSSYDFLNTLFQSDMSPQGSFTCYSNPQVDALLVQARGTLDAEKRRTIYHQVEELVLADLPAVPVYYYRSYRVTDTRVRGFRQDPMGMTDMWTLWVR